MALTDNKNELIAISNWLYFLGGYSMGAAPSYGGHRSGGGFGGGQVASIPIPSYGHSSLGKA